jgi:hypothetical protein
VIKKTWGKVRNAANSKKISGICRFFSTKGKLQGGGIIFASAQPETADLAFQSKSASG